MIPFFVSGTAGRLFCVYHEPCGNAEERGHLLFVPPFAEELNRSRHTVTRMARSLARCGWGVLLLDLYGTGDSQGLFEECRWETWRDDVMTAHAWLRERGCDSIGLWGLRLGALLATEVVADHPDLFSRLVLWQPVISGKKFLNQLLRLGTASAMTDTGAPPISTTELGRRLAAGESLRIAGYPIAPSLAHVLEVLDLTKLELSSKTPVLWIEVIRGEPAELSASSLEVLNIWKARGTNATKVTVIDRPFWSLQSLDPVWADELIAKTIEAL